MVRDALSMCMVDEHPLMSSFKRSNLRRTIIASMPLSIQAFSGIYWIAGYATYYFQLAGFSTSMSFKLGIAQQCCSVLGNVMSVSTSVSLIQVQLSLNISGSWWSDMVDGS